MRGKAQTRECGAWRWRRTGRRRAPGAPRQRAADEVRQRDAEDVGTPLPRVRRLPRWERMRLGVGADAFAGDESGLGQERERARDRDAYDARKFTYL